MKALISILLITTLAGAFWLGRQSRHDLPPGSRQTTAESFEAVFERPGLLQRSLQFHAYLAAAQPGDLIEAAPTMERLHRRLLPHELPDFMLAWARHDPQAALEWSQARTGPFGAEAVGAALRGFAYHDPEAARRAFRALTSGAPDEPLEEQLVSGWVRGGQIDGIDEFIASRPSSLGRQRYTNLLTIELMRDSPDAVIRWAEGIPIDDGGNESFKAMTTQKAANILASDDPARAAAWLEAQLDQAYAQGSVRVVAQRWLEVDAAAAMAWVGGLPGDGYKPAGRSTFMGWRGQDMEAAEAWLAQNTPAPNLDQAVEFMIARNIDVPETALTWAPRLSDPAERTRTIVRTGRAWIKRDPAAARAWLAESGLNPDVQKAIERADRPRNKARWPAPPSGGRL